MMGQKKECSFSWAITHVWGQNSLYLCQEKHVKHNSRYVFEEEDWGVAEEAILHSRFPIVFALISQQEIEIMVVAIRHRAYFDEPPSKN